MVNEVLLCIPGPWDDRKFVFDTILRVLGPRFLFAGMILFDTHTNVGIQMEVFPHDPELTSDFNIVGQSRLSPETLRSIADHRQTIYLHFPLPDAMLREHLLMFSQAIRQIGGMAVMVATSGNVYEFDYWESLLSSTETIDLYKALIWLAQGEDVYYSCGMHHFQLPDCCISCKVPIQVASLAMNVFNMYQINNHPDFANGDTFSTSEETPHYRLILKKDTVYSSDYSQHNPYGRWLLE